jgi:nucleotide-binding universal stress UspA family protein
MAEDDPAYQPQGPLVSAPQLRNALEATGQHILTPAAARATHAQVTHRTVTRRGVIPEQSVRVAETNRGDLIVMGTRQLTGISA